jgi:hypothetical protein
MPVYPTIDPGSISHLLDPLIEEQRRQELGSATGAAISAMEKKDFPGMARAMQYIAGVHPQTAVALMAQRHAMEQERLAQERFYQTPQQLGQKGWMGGPIMGLPVRGGGYIDPFTRKPIEAPAAEGTPAAAATPTPTATTTGEEPTPEAKEQAFLNRYDPTGELHDYIRGVESYQLDPNDVPIKLGYGKWGGKPMRFAVVNGASMLAKVMGHPTYQSGEFKNRNLTYNKWTTDIIPKQVVPIMRAFEHAETANEALAALKNGNYPLVNSIINRWRAARGEGELVGAQVTGKIVMDEAAKAMAGTGSSAVTDRTEYNSFANPNASEAMREASLGALEQMMGEQLYVLGGQFEAETGRKDFNRRLTTPRTRAFVELLQKQHTGEKIDPTTMGFGRSLRKGQQQQPDRAKEIENARAALKAGAPPDEVLKVYRQRVNDPNAQLPTE